MASTLASRVPAPAPLPVAESECASQAPTKAKPVAAPSITQSTIGVCVPSAPPLLRQVP